MDLFGKEFTGCRYRVGIVLLLIGYRSATANMVASAVRNTHSAEHHASDAGNSVWFEPDAHQQLASKNNRASHHASLVQGGGLKKFLLSFVFPIHEYRELEQRPQWQ